jgi:hypothetical protein
LVFDKLHIRALAITLLAMPAVMGQDFGQASQDLLRTSICAGDVIGTDDLIRIRGFKVPR